MLHAVGRIAIEGSNEKHKVADVAPRRRVRQALKAIDTLKERISNADPSIVREALSRFCERIDLWFDHQICKTQVRSTFKKGLVRFYDVSDSLRMTGWSWPNCLTSPNRLPGRLGVQTTAGLLFDVWMMSRCKRLVRRKCKERMKPFARIRTSVSDEITFTTESNSPIYRRRL